MQLLVIFLSAVYVLYLIMATSAYKSFPTPVEKDKSSSKEEEREFNQERLQMISLSKQLEEDLYQRKVVAENASLEKPKNKKKSKKKAKK